MYSTEFKFSVAVVLKWEGGYVNDPNDAGGETKYGISKRAYPELDIKNLTKQDATKIYYTDYWLKGNCDAMPTGVSTVMFDSCVNQGISAATKLMQAAVGVTVDGIYGPVTHNAVLTKHPLKTMNDFTSKRLHKYTEYQTFVHHGKGWFNRVVNVYTKTILFSQIRSTNKRLLQL